MTNNDRKSFLPDLNILIDQYNNNYHHYINEKHLMILLLINDRIRITKYKNIFIKDYTEYCSREIFIIDSVLKTNPCTCKLKGLNARKIIGSFYQKKLLLSILQRSYYPEPDSQIRDKFKLVLNLSNYATKKELDHATSVYTSDLAAKNDLSALKADFGKVDTNKLVNLPTSQNSLKTKVDDLDVGKLKTFPVGLNKLRYIVDNRVVKNTKFNTLKTKINN